MHIVFYTKCFKDITQSASNIKNWFVEEISDIDIYSWYKTYHFRITGMLVKVKICSPTTGARKGRKWFSGKSVVVLSHGTLTSARICTHVMLIHSALKYNESLTYLVSQYG